MNDDILREIDEDDSGQFLLERRDGRAFLRVYPPGRKSRRPVRWPDVRARLALLRITGYDAQFVEDIVDTADAQAYDIAEWPEPAAVDALVAVEISPNEMIAYARAQVARHGGRELDEETVRTALAAAGVVHGVDAAAIRTMLAALRADPASAQSSKRAAPDTAWPVARGTYPTAGHAGQVHYHFEVRPRARPGRAEHGDRVDFRKIRVIQTCEPDQLLATLTPPGVGQPGQTVRGAVIPAPERAAVRVQAGNNVGQQADDQSFRALAAGQIRLEEHETHVILHVEEILTLRAVDYATGHIDFPGTVQIETTVLDGFTVQARGDILIQNTVGPVTLRAGGDIILTGGAFCRGAGRIEARGCIYARFAQEANLHAGLDVLIEEAAMSSEVTAGGRVILDEGRGELIGGTTQAGQLVRVRKLGSKAENTTLVIVGIAPEGLARYHELEQERTASRDRLAKIEAYLKQHGEGRARSGAVGEPDAVTLERLRTAGERTRAAVVSLEAQIRHLGSGLVLVPGAAVEALDAVYPGVEVRFGLAGRRYRVDTRPLPGFSRFVYDDDRIFVEH